MPSVPYQASSSRATGIPPSDSNSPKVHTPHRPSTKPSLEPAQPIASSTPFRKLPNQPHAHVLPRRFIGPIPEKVTKSSQVVEKRNHFRDLHKRAVTRIRSEFEGAGENSTRGFGDAEEDVGKIRRVARKIKVRRRDKQGQQVEDDLDLDIDSVDDDTLYQSKTGKEKWIGESFDIGREFLSTTVIADEATPEESTDSSPTGTSARPPMTAQTTQETFVTARTELESPSASPSASRSVLDISLPDRSDTTPDPSLYGSMPALARTLGTHASVASSVQPLIDEPSAEDGRSRSPRKGKGPSVSREPSMTPSMSNRLKSALRFNSRQDLKSHSVQVPGSPPREQLGRSKTVQFPVDNVQFISPPHERSSRENQSPVDPELVLSREGEEARETSAGAAEDAMGEEEGWLEEPPLAGDIILRDRMLVRVGYHREEGLKAFDEAIQRRTPCQRLETFEEYIVVWRKGLIEFYQDWRLPFQERMTGHKHLCFVVPLVSNRTSLSSFSPDDLTLCLTTSIGRLQRDMDMISREPTSSRLGEMKHRIKYSKQAQWLKGRKHGSQVFIFKLAERSRALDWYWELWRDLGGELHPKFDVVASALGMSIRFDIPEDDEISHDRQLIKHLNLQRIIRTCEDKLRDSTSVKDLLVQRELGGVKEELDLHLTWKASDGELDWITSHTTVEGKPRPWAVLAGLARTQDGRVPRELQLRNARHQPKSLMLEDETRLEEPAGIEGYLSRVRGGFKATIYVTSQDGCIFITDMKESIPPLLPLKEGSIPSDLFSQVHQEFLKSEKKRMYSVIERCAGCVDLRDITSIQYVHKSEEDAEAASDTFDIKLNPESQVRLEAHSVEIATEWVDRLQALRSYWKRRHRVDAKLRMDAASLAARGDKFAGVAISDGPEEYLADLWDWCTIQGCRPITTSGRLHMKSDKWDRFRLKYLVLTNGHLVTFKIKEQGAFHPRKKKYSLFGAYVYSGLLAHEEIHEPQNHREDPFTTRTRVYQDGLQTSDGMSDTIFCVRLAISGSKWGTKSVNPWELEEGEKYVPPALSKTPLTLLIFQARSKLERDRWVWAINSEMERQARAHVDKQQILRENGKIPARW